MGFSPVRGLRGVLPLALVALGCATAPAQETPQPPPAVYTNQENGRRLAVTRGYVALATSGGVRVWDRRAEAWRTLTMHDGLPSHNVVDVAFETAGNGTRLWILSADWTATRWVGRVGGRLHLSSLTLPDGKLQGEMPSPPAPAGEPTRYPFWDQYRLRVTAETVWVYGEKQRALFAWDRQTGGWKIEVASAPPPLALRLPPMGYYGPGRLRAVRNIGAGRGVVAFDRGMFLFQNGAGASATMRFVAFPWTPPAPYGGTYPPVQHSVPFHLKADGAAGGLTFDVIEQKQYTANNLQIPVAHSSLVSYRVETAGEAKLREIARHVLPAESVARLAREAAQPGDEADRLHGGELTDIAVETEGKGSLWFATYNQPGTRATGLARYDLGTQAWTYPTQSRAGITANQIVGMGRAASGAVVAFTTNGGSTFDARTGTWRGGADAAVLPPSVARLLTRFAPDPEKKNRWLQVLDEENRGRVQWVHWRDGSTADAPWRLARLDTIAKTLTPAAALQPGLAGLSVTDLLVQGDKVWLLGEDRGQVPHGPVVVCWDRHANTVVRYASPLWEGNVAKAFAGGLQPGANFYQVAGTLWIRAVYSLFRFDAEAGQWRRESAQVRALYPFPSALWLQEGSGYNALSNNPFLCWSVGATGWQRLNVPPALVPLAGSALLDTGSDVWLGGIGILHLGRTEQQFSPVGAAR